MKPTNAEMSSEKEKTVSTGRVKRKRETKDRVFRKIWLQVEGFRKWLRPDKTDPKYAMCITCDTKISCRFGVLKEHAKSQHHCRYSGVYEPFPPNYFHIPESVDVEQKSKVAAAELKFVGMCTQLNIPFVNMPKMLKTIQYIDKDCKNSIFHSMHVGSTKARNLVVNIIGSEQDDTFCKMLSDDFFGICLYKRIDVKGNTFLDIVARYYNPETGEIKNKLWDQAPICHNGQESTTDKLFKSFNLSFSVSDIPVQNISSICYETGEIALNDVNGLKLKLEAELLGTVTNECLVNKMHLCLYNAMDQIPNDIHCFIVNVNNMLNDTNDFGNLHIDSSCPTAETFKVDILSVTQSLTFEACVKRILDKWKSIQEIATELSLQNDIIANEIIEIMNKMDTKSYLLLLLRVFSEINELNKAFQSDDILLHKVNEMLDKTYKSIASMVLKEDYILQTPASEIEILDNPNLLKNQEFNISEEINFYLKENYEDLQNFCENSFNFVVSFTTEMKKNFHDLKNPLYDAVMCLCPKNATSKTYKENNPNVFTNLLSMYSKIIKDDEHKQKILSEWTELDSFSMNIEEIITQFPNIDNFWHFLRHFEEDGICKYVNVAKFALLVLCTPYTNVKVDHSYNSQKYVKTKTKKNNMYDSTINATVKAQKIVKAGGGESFQPSPLMIKKALACQYYNI